MRILPRVPWAADHSPGLALCDPSTDRVRDIPLEMEAMVCNAVVGLEDEEDRVPGAHQGSIVPWQRIPAVLTCGIFDGRRWDCSLMHNDLVNPIRIFHLKIFKKPSVKRFTINI